MIGSYSENPVQVLEILASLTYMGNSLQPLLQIQNVPESPRAVWRVVWSQHTVQIWSLFGSLGAFWHNLGCLGPDEKLGGPIWLIGDI